MGQCHFTFRGFTTHGASVHGDGTNPALDGVSAPHGVGVVVLDGEAVLDTGEDIIMDL